ncbi:hypothetical protein BV25DRAFT_1916915 [Artomyces pyxidatus]|uniref:Uncharacterized protein n=1 Tax=Artomyces pyxidatus TaxID=48021 RepID=A0ACB8T0E1_9AGAM|nr:hypothetical protein BV25DRAFT_1916915 [Artomyces pyxidatus]
MPLQRSPSPATPAEAHAEAEALVQRGKERYAAAKAIRKSMQEKLANGLRLHARDEASDSSSDDEGDGEEEAGEGRGDGRAGTRRGGKRKRRDDENWGGSGDEEARGPSTSKRRGRDRGPREEPGLAWALAYLEGDLEWGAEKQALAQIAADTLHDVAKIARFSERHGRHGEWARPP